MTGTTTTRSRVPRASTVVIHPRIRNRRIEVLRDAGRRRLRRVLAGLSVVTAAVAVVALARSSLLDVDTIRTTGGERTGREALLAAAGIEARDAMVGLDLGAAAERVEALPWVAEATVRRHWPGTVEIAVRERVPVAAAPLGEGRWAVADRTGHVVAVEDAAPEGLPAIEGAGDGEVVAGASLPGPARDAIVVAAALEEALPGEVVAVSTDLEATLAYGGTVRFGSTDDLGDKVVAVETVFTQVDLSCPGTLDVRAPASPAMTRGPGC